MNISIDFNALVDLARKTEIPAFYIVCCDRDILKEVKDLVSTNPSLTPLLVSESFFPNSNRNSIWIVPKTLENIGFN